MDNESKNEGLRYDEGKARVDLLSPIALLGIAKILEVGARKYAVNNWRKGMAWNKVIASLLRHTFKFMAGEDLDQETGLPHVDHIACNAMFLQEYFRLHKPLDDRFKLDSNSLK
jgi:hypothetical protein